MWSGRGVLARGSGFVWKTLQSQGSIYKINKEMDLDNQLYSLLTVVASTPSVSFPEIRQRGLFASLPPCPWLAHPVTGRSPERNIAHTERMVLGFTAAAGWKTMCISFRANDKRFACSLGLPDRVD